MNKIINCLCKTDKDICINKEFTLKGSWKKKNIN